MANHSGHFMTGRNPRTLDNLIKNHGDSIWMGPDGNADRGDRYSHRPYKPPPTEGPTPVQNDTPSASQALKLLTAALRTTVLGRAAIDPIDANAPAGTQTRRIAAHNALLDLAKPGRDRFCGTKGSTMIGPCLLVDGHRDATFDDTTTHMDAAQRDRAIRYLVHSDPDPKQRA